MKSVNIYNIDSKPKAEGNSNNFNSTDRDQSNLSDTFRSKGTKRSRLNNANFIENEVAKTWFVNNDSNHTDIEKSYRKKNFEIEKFFNDHIINSIYNSNSKSKKKNFQSALSSSSSSSSSFRTKIEFNSKNPKNLLKENLSKMEENDYKDQNTNNQIAKNKRKKFFKSQTSLISLNENSERSLPDNRKKDFINNKLKRKSYSNTIKNNLSQTYLRTKKHSSLKLKIVSSQSLEKKSNIKRSKTEMILQKEENSKENSKEKISPKYKLKLSKNFLNLKSTRMQKESKFQEKHLNIIKNQIKNNIFLSYNNTVTIEKKKTDIDIHEKSRKLIKKGLIYDSMSDDEFDSFANSPYSVHPESTIKILLDFLVFIALIYSMIYLPIRLIYSDKASFDFCIVELIFDMIYITDFFLCFFIGFYDFEENYITKKFEIFSNYIQNHFFTDLIAAIPVNSLMEFNTLKERNLILLNSNELLFLNGEDSLFKQNNILTFSQIFQSYNENKVINIYRLIRILKFLKVNSKNSFINYIGREFNLEYTQGAINRLLFFFLNFLLISHILTCIFIFLGSLKIPNWIISQNLQNSSFANIYLSSLYFNHTTIFTIGYGDVLSKNFYERLYNILLMVVGIMLYSFAITSISNIIQQQDEKTKIYLKNMEYVNQLTSKYKINRKLEENINRYFKYDWSSNKKDKNELLKELPISLRNEMIVCMYRNIINSFIFFKNFQSLDFIIKAIISFKPVKSIKNEILVKEGDYIEEIIFVKKGVLSLEVKLSLSEHHKKIKGGTDEKLYIINQLEIIKKEELQKLKIIELRRNEHFGDISIFLKEKSPLSVRTRTKYAELFLMKKADLMNLTEEYPDIFEEIYTKSSFNMYQIQNFIKKAKRIYYNKMNKTIINRNKIKSNLFKMNTLNSMAEGEEENLLSKYKNNGESALNINKSNSSKNFSKDNPKKNEINENNLSKEKLQSKFNSMEDSSVKSEKSYIDNNATINLNKSIKISNNDNKFKININPNNFELNFDKRSLYDDTKNNNSNNNTKIDNNIHNQDSNNKNEFKFLSFKDSKKSQEVVTNENSLIQTFDLTENKKYNNLNNQININLSKKISKNNLEKYGGNISSITHKEINPICLINTNCLGLKNNNINLMNGKAILNTALIKNNNKNFVETSIRNQLEVASRTLSPHKKRNESYKEFFLQGINLKGHQSFLKKNNFTEENKQIHKHSSNNLKKFSMKNISFQDENHKNKKNSNEYLEYKDYPVKCIFNIDNTINISNSNNLIMNPSPKTKFSKSYNNQNLKSKPDKIEYEEESQDSKTIIEEDLNVYSNPFSSRNHIKYRKSNQIYIYNHNLEIDFQNEFTISTDYSSSKSKEKLHTVESRKTCFESLEITNENNILLKREYEKCFDFKISTKNFNRKIKELSDDNSNIIFKPINGFNSSDYCKHDEIINKSNITERKNDSMSITNRNINSNFIINQHLSDKNDKNTSAKNSDRTEKVLIKALSIGSKTETPSLTIIERTKSNSSFNNNFKFFPSFNTNDKKEDRMKTIITSPNEKLNNNSFNEKNLYNNHINFNSMDNSNNLFLNPLFNQNEPRRRKSMSLTKMNGETENIEILPISKFSEKKKSPFLENIINKNKESPIKEYKSKFNSILVHPQGLNIIKKVNENLKKTTLHITKPEVYYSEMFNNILKKKKNNNFQNHKKNIKSLNKIFSQLKAMN